jgi:hypothetical protein
MGLVLTLRSACAAAAMPLQAEPTAVQSGRVVLVELFTSEGCSSCPPADDMLREIDGKRTSEGSLILGISEHVTYWDHGGWKDPFGSDTTTERQDAYRLRFGLDSVYTPQMVVNGESQFVGGNTHDLLEALERTQAESQDAVRIVSVKLNGDMVEAVVSIAGAVPARGGEVFVVVAEDETTQHVLRGENKGRTLRHASVARSIVKAGKITAAGESTVRVKLPEEAALPGARRHLIVWVQEPGLGRMLGAGTQSF